MRSTKIIKICSSSLCTCLHHMVILRTRNKITNFLMILGWASPFNVCWDLQVVICHSKHIDPMLATVDDADPPIDQHWVDVSGFLVCNNSSQVINTYGADCPPYSGIGPPSSLARWYNCCSRHQFHPSHFPFQNRHGLSH